MRSFYFLILILLTAGIARAQCPVASITLPDTLCAGSDLNVVNNSTGTNALLYNWDFNAGDLNTAPTGAFIDTFSTELLNCLGMDIAVQNDSIYGIAIKSSGQLSRFDFGTSLSNFPVANNLGNPGMTFGGNDLVIENIDGNWYGFTANFSSVVYRMDFGSSITNTPTVTMLNTGSNLNGPYYIDFVNDNGRYYLLASNINNGTLSILDFGNNITNNNPAIVNYSTPGSTVISVTAGNDCGNWHVFVGYVGSSFLTRFDFGNSLSNPLQNTVSVSVPGGIAVRKIELLRDNGNWYLAVISVPGDEMKMYNFGPSLNNLTPVIKGFGGFGSVAYGNQTFAIKKYKSDFLGLSPNYIDGRLSQFKFQNPNAGATIQSNDAQPVIQFTSPGRYNIELLVTDSVNGLTSATYDSIYVLPAANPSFSTGLSCKDQAVTFINTTQLAGLTATNLTWHFGDTATGSGDTTSHIYINSGSYTVNLDIQVSNGCISTADTVLTVHENPVAAYSTNDYNCSGIPVVFADVSQSTDGIISNYDWGSGDGQTGQGNTFANTYTSGGNYLSRLIVTTEFGCNDTAFNTVHVLYRPHSNFTTSNTCIGETVNYTNQSTIDTALALNFVWLTGDGNSTTAIDPVVSYPATDSSYQITLISSASNGCNDTLLYELHIGQPSIAYFNISDTLFCSGSELLLTDSSYSLNADTIIARYWSFGDGTYDSSAVHPAHIYQLPGTYTITLTTVTPSHCTAQYTRQITVLGSPVAGFITSNVCSGNISLFQDTSTSAFGSITSWHWDFGDNSTSVLQHPDHTFSAEGVYEVLLEVSNVAGCTDTQAVFVYVYELPQANFGAGLSCTGKPVQFTDSSTVNAGQINQWTWDFGDGSPADFTQAPAHQFGSAQLYTVQLIAKSSFGCADTISKFIAVKAAPDFTPVVSDVCFGTASAFQYSPGAGQNSSYDYYWNFGDNTFSFQQNTNHTYSLAGNYPVTLTVRDLATNCSAIKSDTAFIYQLPVASFSSDSICAGGTIQFVNTSSSATGNITAFNWNFGALGTSQLENPTLTVNISGTVSTQLTVTSSFGCKDSVSGSVKVHPLPVSSFTTSYPFGTPPFAVTFSNASSTGSYFWDFGDGSTGSSVVNPVHTYGDTGTFHITLVTVTDKGCADTATGKITALYPFLDLGVENLNFVRQNGTWKISCRVRNSGNISIQSFRLSALLQGKSSIEESRSGINIEPGETYDFTFQAEFIASEQEDPGFLCIQVVSVNEEKDDNAANNEQCTGNTASFNIIAMYPVPATDYLQLAIGIPEDGYIQYEIHDAAGKQVSQSSLNFILKGYHQEQLDLTNFQSGLYLLKIAYNGKTIIRKFTCY